MVSAFQVRKLKPRVMRPHQLLRGLPTSLLRDSRAESHHPKRQPLRHPVNVIIFHRDNLFPHSRIKGEYIPLYRMLLFY